MNFSVQLIDEEGTGFVGIVQDLYVIGATPGASEPVVAPLPNSEYSRNRRIIQTSCACRQTNGYPGK